MWFILCRSLQFVIGIVLNAPLRQLIPTKMDISNLILFLFGVSLSAGRVIEETTQLEEATGTDVEPPKHLPGFKFERDGGPNDDYHKEVFLGDATEIFVADKPKINQAQKLKRIFMQVDKDENGLVSLEELSGWILHSAQYHIQASKEDAKQKFERADADTDGFVSWPEYISMILTNHFLQGIDEVEDLDAIDAKNLKMKIEELKSVWDQMQDKDGLLDRRQFYMFLHPETNESVGLIVNNIMIQRDLDGDERLSMPEYVYGKVSSPNEEDVRDKNKIMEFLEFVDHNRDQYVTAEELQEFMKADSESNAMYEAHEMLWTADINKDFQLSMDEVLQNSEYFTGSKLCNYENLDHQEL